MRAGVGRVFRLSFDRAHSASPIHHLQHAGWCTSSCAVSRETIWRKRVREVRLRCALLPLNQKAAARGQEPEGNACRSRSYFMKNSVSISDGFVLIPLSSAAVLVREPRRRTGVKKPLAARSSGFGAGRSFANATWHKPGAFLGQPLGGSS